MSEPSRTTRVLVIDDEEEFATTTAELLARRGFHARAVFDGAAGLEAMREEAFDALVLDLRMPGLDGLAVLREVRRLAPEVRVVMLTGHGSAETGITGMQLGAVDFLQKPVDIDTLAAVIRSAVDRARND